MKLASCLLFSFCLGLSTEGCSDDPARSHDDHLGHGEGLPDAGLHEDHEGHDHDSEMHATTDSTCTNGLSLSPGDQVRSKEGLFTVRLVGTSPKLPRKGENAWTLRLVDEAGQALMGASLTSVVPFMPEHGHDGRFAPQVSAGDEPGTFVVERINLWMGGRWEVRISGMMSGAEDMAVLEACIAD